MAAARLAPRNREGFTIVELIIYTIMLGFVLGITVPKIVAATQRITIRTVATELRADLHRARAEAGKINGIVAVTRLSPTQYELPGVGVRTLPDGVTFTASSPSAVKFSSYGPVVAGAGAFGLTLGAHSAEVVVSAAGHASTR